MFIVIGPGHGAPAMLSNLFLEGALQKFYPKYGNNEEVCFSLQTFSIL